MQQSFVYRGAIEKLPLCLEGKKKLLLFCGKASWRKLSSKIVPFLAEKDCCLYNDFSPNPKKEEIERALEKCRAHFDAIIAVGGGSVIDFAKAFRFFRGERISLMAVPTTAGTGSEATQFAVVYVKGQKTSLDDQSLLPDFALVDSRFSEDAPVYLKASCAMDAYCQAIESFWAKRATQESRKYALEAVALCREFLLEAVLSDEQKANEKMALAAHLSGKAINISRTTAAHALSYVLTSKYGIPHGHAVALSISGLFLCNMEAVDVRPVLEAMRISREEVSSYFHNLMEKTGLETDLKKLNVGNLDELVENVNPERLENNPKKLSREDLIKILSV